MTRISKFKVKGELLEKLGLLVFEIVGNSSNKSEFDLILTDLLSPTERIMIAKRIAIVYLILKNIDYRQISETLKVSQATISKFRLLMERSEGLIPAFQRILAKDKIVSILENIFAGLFSPGRYGVNWKNAWRYQKYLEQKKLTGL